MVYTTSVIWVGVLSDIMLYGLKTCHDEIIQV